MSKDHYHKEYGVKITATETFQYSGIFEELKQVPRIYILIQDRPLHGDSNIESCGCTIRALVKFMFPCYTCSLELWQGPKFAVILI